MKILRKADQLYIAKRLAALYSIVTHWDADDIEFLEKALFNIGDIAYRVGSMDMMDCIPKIAEQLTSRCFSCSQEENNDRKV